MEKEGSLKRSNQNEEEHRSEPGNDEHRSEPGNEEHRGEQGNEEHRSEQGNERSHLEEYKGLIDVTDAGQQILNPERPDVEHKKNLNAFIRHNRTATKKLKKINGKIKDGLIEELKTGNLSLYVKDALAYICEAELQFADIQAAVQFFIDLDAKSDIKRVLKKALNNYYSSIAQLLRSEHLFLHVTESGNANILNAKEPTLEITALHKKLQKSVEKLLCDVCLLAESLDKRPPLMPKLRCTSRVTPDLPIHVISEEIYRILPASDILCARLVSRNWYMAYTSGFLDQVQPADGGSIPLGFLLATDRLQRRASSGFKMRHHFQGLDQHFPARDARIIASSCGLYLIHMRHPEGMMILNPAVGQSREVNPPVTTEQCAYTGLTVSFSDTSQVATRYCVVVPYLPRWINDFADEPRIRFRIWSSQEGGWRINPSIVEPEDFSPRNVVTVGQTVYFHISRDEIVFYDVDEDEPGLMHMPQEVAGIVEVALCCWKGALGILYYDLVVQDVQIYTLEDNGWIYKVNIGMKLIVERNRSAFRSLSLTLRSRLEEEFWEPLLDIQLVGYADPGWLLIRQRNGWVLIDVVAKTARRVRLGEMQNMFFSSRLSSFLRLS